MQLLYQTTLSKMRDVNNDIKSMELELDFYSKMFLRNSGESQFLKKMDIKGTSEEPFGGICGMSNTHFVHRKLEQELLLFKNEMIQKAKNDDINNPIFPVVVMMKRLDEIAGKIYLIDKKNEQERKK